MKLRVNQPGGILTQGPKVVISRGSFVTFLFDSFGIEMKIRMNQRDSDFPKRPRVYISSSKLAGFAGS